MPPGETGDDAPESCGWKLSLDYPSQQDLRIEFESLLHDDGTNSSVCQITPAASGIRLTCGDVLQALELACEQIPLSLPQPGNERIQTVSIGAPEAKPLRIRLSRWITALLLLCDNADFQAWQQKYMSLVIRQHAVEEPVS